MRHVVIVGAGQSGVEAACALREEGFTGEITLVGEESGTPYQRPPLSKGLTQGREEDLLPLRSSEELARLGVRYLDATTVEAVDRATRTVRLGGPAGRGARLRYDHLILATGGRARGAGPDGGLLPGESGSGVFRLRTSEDAGAVARALSAARSVTVIGGGVIGLECATVAAAAGRRVTVLERGHRILRRFVGADAAGWLHRRHEERGVRLMTRTSVEGFELDSAGAVGAVRLGDGDRIETDLVLVGTGVTAEDTLARSIGLTCRRGVVVDERLRTSDPHISAIGDCAVFPSPHCAGERRIESVQNATDQAGFLARALAGAGSEARSLGSAAAYASLPWFWSVQAGVKVQVAGLADTADAAVTIGDPEAGKFSVLRFAAGRLVCVESIGRPADHLAARRLLAAGAGPTLREAREGGISQLKTWSDVVPV